MTGKNHKGAVAPIVTCDPKLASFLGAARLSEAAAPHAFGDAAMPVVATDGSRWIWPLEPNFVAAIERQR